MFRRAVTALRARDAPPEPGPAPGDDHPDLEPEFRVAYERCAPYTMTSVERMYALWQAAGYIARAGVPGDYVECGVWRGGSSMLAALTFARAEEQGRRLWLYDTFEGMTEPTDRDRAFDSATPISDQWGDYRTETGFTLAYASLGEVEANMQAAGIAPDRLEYVVGPVEETIPARAPEQISLLRLDTDWYSSTRHELEHLYPKLSPGGVLIVDDYGHWAGAREAVDEFFGSLASAPLLSRIDYTGRLAVKPR
jgi:hypothetical protein